MEDQVLRRQPRPAAGAGGRRAGIQRIAAGARIPPRRPPFRRPSCQQSRPATAIAAARERLRPMRAMGIAVHELALKARSEASRAVLAPLLACQGHAGAGPEAAPEEHADQPAGAAGRCAQIGEVSRGAELRAATRRRRRSGTPSTRATTALIDSPGFQSSACARSRRRAAAADADFREPSTRLPPTSALPAACWRPSSAAAADRASRHRIYGEIRERA